MSARPFFVLRQALEKQNASKVLALSVRHAMLSSNYYTAAVTNCQEELRGSFVTLG